MCANALARRACGEPAHAHANRCGTCAPGHLLVFRWARQAHADRLCQHPAGHSRGVACGEYVDGDARTQLCRRTGMRLSLTVTFVRCAQNACCCWVPPPPPSEPQGLHAHVGRLLLLHGSILSTRRCLYSHNQGSHDEGFLSVPVFGLIVGSRWAEDAFLMPMRHKMGHESRHRHRRRRNAAHGLHNVTEVGVIAPAPGHARHLVARSL